MRSHSTTDRPQRLAPVLLALPFVAVGFLWAMIAVAGLLGLTESGALWGVALVVAVGFVAVAILIRLALVAGSVLLLVVYGLRRAGRLVGRITHA